MSLPVLLAWGWVRWARQRQSRTVCGILSLIGFTFASLSALLAIFLAVYGRVIGHFQYYDPALMRIYGVGLLLSMVGFGFGISGVWKANPLRWHAPACAIGTFLYWFFLAASE
ncbi:MAG: hypothetical protein ABSG32_01815 [Terriglobia bacterium]